MIETYRCDDKDQLVAFLYDDIDPVSRRRVEEHLRVCPTCAAEIGALGEVRHTLAEWQPPDTVLEVVVPLAEGSPHLNGPHLNGSSRPLAVHDRALAESRGEVVRPARWWTSPALPAWAQAAAAVLVVAAGLAMANIQLRYDANGLVVTTGWMTPVAPAPAPAANAAVVPTSAQVAPEDWRTALASLERELRDEIQSTRTRPTMVSTSPAREADGPSIERVSALIEESEQRQKRELALRLTQVVRDIELQRRTDNRRNVQAIGQFEGLAGAEMLRQRQALDYIMRVSTQPPPQ